jgi:hypothetical protein
LCITLRRLFASQNVDAQSTHRQVPFCDNMIAGKEVHLAIWSGNKQL